MATKTTITVTTTETKTTTMPASSLSCNIGALKTVTGLLKLLETITGAICLGLLLHIATPAEALSGLDLIIIQLTVLAFLVTTFLLLVSYLVSYMAANVMEKSIFELLYHFFACIFYLASVVILNVIADEKSGINDDEEERTAVALSVLGVLNAIFYGVSAYYSYKACKSS